MGSGFDARLKKLEEKVRKAEEERSRSEQGVMLGVSALGRPQLETRCDWILRFERKYGSCPERHQFAVLYWFAYLQSDSDYTPLLRAGNPFVVEANKTFSREEVNIDQILKTWGHLVKLPNSNQRPFSPGMETAG